MRSPSASRSVRGALTGALALGLASTALTTPAQAADGWDRCPSGKVCAFSKPLYQGDMLVVSKPMYSLGAWDNRIRSFVNLSADAVCFYPQPGFAPEGSVHFYTAESFDESAYPELDRAASSIDVGPEADDFCGSESRIPTWYGTDAGPKLRPASSSALGAFGDIDNDGYADLLTRDAIGGLWTSHTWESTGTTQRIGGGWNSMTKLVRHGDHDGDGNEDVLARDSAGVLWFYPGNGKGLFKPRVRIGAGWNSMRDIAAAGDLTGDGRADLLAADGAGDLWTYPGNGRGSFGARKKVGGGWKVMNELVGAGDMNSDKRADLMARDTAGRLWLYPGTGRGTFGVRKLVGSGGWNSLKELAGLGDLTGDGRPDLVAHAPGTDSWDRTTPMYLRVYPGKADGGLGAPKPFALLRSSHFVF
ncbi:FG-GAP-like repeat-containing protein [Streptomyces sp. NPDC013457]|uniref:FG-GAP-like repeat-containing protein n=1 Tax=Streptomyces sp. NPDC013457 TaxID=3364866 RepID=UPI0036F88610